MWGVDESYHLERVNTYRCNIYRGWTVPDQHCQVSVNIPGLKSTDIGWRGLPAYLPTPRAVSTQLFFFASHFEWGSMTCPSGVHCKTCSCTRCVHLRDEYISPTRNSTLAGTNIYMCVLTMLLYWEAESVSKLS